ncbi:MAG: Crp/Fnr family transcriptional regulator [Burkholderiaceae bacterium]
MHSPQSAQRNLLLDMLPDDARKRLARNLETRQARVGQVLHASHAPVRYAYFPTSAILEKVGMMQNGDHAQVAMIGREGMVGLSLFLGAELSVSSASVQSAGQVLRLPAGYLQEEFERGGDLMRVLLRYTQSFIEQMVRTAACNRYGTLEQRLCRWLLQSLDRSAGGELTMTHERMANALGARRAGVSLAAALLQRRGAIHYQRGHIQVLNRAVLEARVCECYPATSAAQPMTFADGRCGAERFSVADAGAVVRQSASSGRAIFACHQKDT